MNIVLEHERMRLVDKSIRSRLSLNERARLKDLQNMRMKYLANPVEWDIEELKSMRDEQRTS